MLCSRKGMVKKASGSRVWKAGLGAGLVLVAFASATGAQVPPPPDLSGTWELNGERSDDPVEKLRGALRSQPDLDRQRGGSRLGRSRPNPRDEGLEERQARLERLAESLRIVAIAHRDPILTFESGLADSDWTLTAYTDGREFQRPSPTGETVSAVAGWERGGRLVVRYEPVEDLQAVETWELVAEGSRIILTTEITGRSISPVRYQRIYDRVEIIPWAVPDQR